MDDLSEPLKRIYTQLNNLTALISDPTLSGVVIERLGQIDLKLRMYVGEIAAAADYKEDDDG